MLFDKRLIGIEPEKLIVRINSRLKDTIYGELDGKVLASRKDGLRPDIEALKERWELFSNIRK